MDKLPEKGDIESTERRLSHTHDHHDHDHEGGHVHTPHGHHDHTHDHDHSDIDLQSIKDGLRGSSIRLGKRRKLQASQDYNYQVDIFLEIDNELCVLNGESCPAGGSIGPATMNYVNSIFAGANTIYEVRPPPAFYGIHMYISRIRVHIIYTSYVNTLYVHIICC